MSTSTSFLNKASLKDGVYFLTNQEAFQAFETAYLTVREKEQRFYTDEVIESLPYTTSQHPYHAEWELRVQVVKPFLAYLKKHHNKGTVLEIGCGNGWLSAQMAKNRSGEVIGLDVNQVELIEGARIFQKNTNLHFVFADVFEKPFPPNTFDVIVLAGAIQYLADFHHFIETLKGFLTPTGEIHIFDSPFYEPAEKEKAKARTLAYFTAMGNPEMADNFNHHTLNVLENYSVEELYKPHSFKSKLLRKLGKPMNPFSWYCIRNA